MSLLNSPYARRRGIAALLVGMAAWCIATGAHSQNFPTRPVRLMVAYPAGGSIDFAARRLSEDLAHELGQPVVVENRGGANGITASESVLRTPADGHTILFTTLPAHAGNRWAYKKLPYDTIADFTPVTVLSVVPLVLVVHPSVQANTVAELVKLARERRMSYASFGVGGMAHLAGVQLNMFGNVDINHVPYKGGGPALADLLGGHVDMYYTGASVAQPLVRDGKLKAIAVTSATRISSLPNVPAVAETPGFESFEASVPPFLLVPVKTPPAVVARLHAALQKVTATNAFRAKLEAAGEGEPRATTPEESLSMLRREVDRLGALFKAANIERE